MNARNMGKKGSWLSAIKRLFSSHSKEKPAHNESDNKTSKEKKKGRGLLRHGESKSFIPLFKEPSSIEKILDEADQQKLFFRPPTPPLLFTRAGSPRATSPRSTSPRATSPSVTAPRVACPWVISPRFASPRAASPKDGHQHIETWNAYRPEPTLRYHHLSATKIQAAYRGYMARRSFRALRGLVRLQGVVRGQNVKRQTMNAMKHMQLLVRVQSQIQSRRIQMLETQALQRQAYRNDKEAESTLSKWTLNQMSEAGTEDWDDSLLTKEEIEARMQRKVEAVIKRERAMAYAYSHQLWKSNPKSPQSPLMDIRSGGFPWWWTWLERQIPPANPTESHAAMKKVHLTPLRPVSEYEPSPMILTSNYKQQNFGYENHESLTPRSSKSTVPVRTRPMHTPSRTPPNYTPFLIKYSKPRPSAPDSTFDIPMKDDDSLMSCPPFSVPNYMVPTVSAKAKVRPSSNPKERLPGTPSNDLKRRISFPLTPNLGSFKWNRGSNKDSTSQRVMEQHQSLQSTGDLSVDSAVSMPATVGRKPFNRFV